MPRIQTILFTGSVLFVLLCQGFARQMNFSYFTPTADLLLAFVLLVWMAGILTSRPEARPCRKPIAETVKTRKNQRKRNFHDTIR